jgi:hypothetical protein
VALCDAGRRQDSDGLRQLGRDTPVAACASQVVEGGGPRLRNTGCAASAVLEPTLAAVAAVRLLHQIGTLHLDRG